MFHSICSIKLCIQLDQLDASVLDGHRELRLAHLQLSLIASGYVWQDGDKGVATVRLAAKIVTLYNNLFIVARSF